MIEQKEISYPTISTQPIPLSFDENMMRVYKDQQLIDHLNLPFEMVPEKEICENGHKYITENKLLEREGIIIYSSKSVVKLNKHKGKIIPFIIFRVISAIYIAITVSA